MLCVSIVFVLGATAAGCGRDHAVAHPSPSTSAGADALVARVNGHAVHRSEVEAARGQAALEQRAQTYEQARDAVVGEELVRGEAARLGLSVGAADVDRRLAEIASSAGGTEALSSALQAVGLTGAQLRARIAVTLLEERVGQAKSPAGATTAQARAFYDANRSLFKTVAAVDLGDIAVRSEGLAKSAWQRLRKGEAFETAARQFARDPQGGRLGWVLVSSMPAALAKAAAGLRTGRVSPPVAAAGGWHVIKVFGRRAAHTLTFAQARAAIVKELTRRQRMAAVQAWLRATRPAAKVELLP